MRLPQLQLDELLQEVQARLDLARGTRDRVHSLLDAVLAVGRELDLQQALRGIVEAAASLVDARYAALGVIGPDGRRLSAFHTVGVDENGISEIGAHPEGHGILGELIRRPRPLRLTRLSEHASSFGLPPNHPPMDSFLGVPIRVRDQVFGNLYLTEKRGGAQFDEDDEAVLSTLAVAAGVAIDNARLYEESRLRERWLRANAEVTHSLMSGTGRTEVLRLVADRAREITGAARALVAVPVDGGETLRVELATGADGERFHGAETRPGSGLLGTAFSSAAPVTSDDVAHDERLATSAARVTGLGPAVALPIGTGDTEVRGVVMLMREAGEPVYTEQETEPLQAFAAQAAIAMELADRRHDAERVAVLQDRDRIARDLHDLAIQRLFATGMTLQSAGRFIEHPRAADRVVRAVDDLDETIKIIRSTVFGLRSHADGTPSGLRARVVRVAGRAAPVLGFAPAVRMQGLVDTDVSPRIADHVVAVLSEALTNVARHAHASRADVSLETDRRAVRLTVTDDGVGMPSGGRRSGVRNMGERAGQLGGTMDLSTPDGGGTRLVWHVPLGGDHVPPGGDAGPPATAQAGPEPRRS
ncbi:sensor histidine kinase [Streptomyces abyssomicinicus]|uniref:sensor histidine kinase n=1 Tax=Streptomyces abyssomicinicus TaxID=574929 RepID=UPI0012505EB8|nr:GAF domain-containing protein [Streptomyces abyssomicinicus]